MLKKSVPFSESDHWSQEASQTGPHDKTEDPHKKRRAGGRTGWWWGVTTHRSRSSIVGIVCTGLLCSDLMGQNRLLGANTEKMVTSGHGGEVGAEVDLNTGL